MAKNNPAAAQWISGALGALVNKATGESTTAGAATASYATKWNENQQLSGYERDDYFTQDMFKRDQLDLVIAEHRREIEAFAINEAKYLRNSGKYIIDNTFDYMSIQGSAVFGPKLGAAGVIIDRNGGVYASFAAGFGVSVGAPVTVSFGVVKDKNYINSLSGYFGNITAHGGVGGSIAISGAGPTAQVNMSPSVELSSVLGKVWYIGNIWDL